MRDVMVELFDGPHATPPPAEEGPVFLGIKNITDAGLLDLGNVRHIAEAHFPKWTRRVTPEPGDVVFTYEATLHRYALVPEGFRGCLGRRVALIRPDRKVVRPRFLHFALLGPAWRSTVAERIVSGATVDRIPLVGFDDFPIVIPDLHTQDEVVEVLGSLDDLIENNRRRVEVLEEMAQAIYREWFVHFRFPDHEDATFIDSDLGPSPEGWTFTSLGSIATAHRTTVQPKRQPDTVFSHYSIPAFDDGQLPVMEPGERIRSGKFVVDGPAVMVSKLNPRIPRTWYVEPAAGSPSVASTEFVILRPDGDRTLEWIYLTATSPDFEDRLKQLSGGTSGSHQRLRPDEMLAIRVLDPTPDLIARAAEVVRPCLELARRLRRQSQHLCAIRDLLLPKLVTGQIDVSDLDLGAVVERVAV
jgi:type I restriction enzyme S subunit